MLRDIVRVPCSEWILIAALSVTGGIVGDALTPPPPRPYQGPNADGSDPTEPSAPVILADGSIVWVSEESAREDSCRRCRDAQEPKRCQ
jgi:hypothetical protein